MIVILAFLMFTRPTFAAEKYEFITDTKSTCVFAPLAKSEAEKKKVLEAAAMDFIKKKQLNQTHELCLAFIKPETPDSVINSYGYPGSGFETINPGKISWIFVGTKPQFKIVLNPGYEMGDAYQFIQSMLKHLKGDGCRIKDDVEGCLPDMRKVKELIHHDLKIQTHPLDTIITN